MGIILVRQTFRIEWLGNRRIPLFVEIDSIHDQGREQIDRPYQDKENEQVGEDQRTETFVFAHRITSEGKWRTVTYTASMPDAAKNQKRPIVLKEKRKI